MTLLCSCVAVADAPTGTLRLPASTLDRSGPVTVVYDLGERFSGHATLRLRWTDSLGRRVADRTLSAELTDATRIPFDIDMTHALAMKNHLRVDVSLSGRRGGVRLEGERESAEADFVARPPFTGWKDYIIMMWHPYPADLLPALKRLGINAGQYSGRLEAAPDFLIDNNVRWYSESLVPRFYAEYHRWRRNQPKDLSFTRAKQEYQENPDSLDAFKRHPGLEDPVWRQRVHDRSRAMAKRNAPYRPYFYSLSDEPGIAELAAQWDFDFSESSLAGMRSWLRSQYHSLAALNAEWGMDFPSWDRVMPMTTRQAMTKQDHNFAAWADFKAWMDVSFAGALKMGADAVREGDPDAFVGFGGSQMPGWGGYDYARLTKAVTAIEIYDIGRSVDIVHSLDPSIPILGTGFSSGRWEKHRVWHELLHGNRGLILWDPDRRYVQPDGQPTKAGLRSGRYYNEIRDGTGALIINSPVVNDPIAVHYSQPSLRTQWLLERRADSDGDDTAWMRRGAKYERTHNLFMRLRESWANLIEDQGLQHRFVSYQQLEQGELRKRGYRVLILPQSSSLSPAEATAIRDFVTAGGVAIASGMPGTYDEHSRKRATSVLKDMFGPKPAPAEPSPTTDTQNQPAMHVRRIGQGKAILLGMDIASYLQRRLTGDEAAMHRTIEQLLRANDIRPRFAVEDDNGHAVVGIDTHVLANGRVRIISLQSNPQLRVDELGPPDFQSNKRFETPIRVRLRLPTSMYVYDIRARTELGRRNDLALTVDPYEPTLLAVSDTPLPGMQVTAPARARRGSIVEVGMRTAPTQADVNVFHVTVRNPQGERMLAYSGNVIVRAGGGRKRIPLALNDPTGTWRVTVHDLLSGQTVTRRLDVE
ncbi:beta-galactosidase [Salinisphaera aquimarina]|uniref:Beta-galactosidase n=1 Tax=Salinisphaera aquimarina TaxID=2094031 RepID=A0ABV7EM45_9GAMM